MTHGPYQSITPNAGEQYRQFVERAHYALMQTIPDPDERNATVWQSWASMHGDPLTARAEKRFPADRYRTVKNVCYFMEHSTTGRDGRPVQYSVKEIADIVDEHNQRSDTDFYTALSNGHTIDGAGVPDSMQPRVVGYAGPYRLGMVGYSNPKFAVFADEHHERHSLDVLDRKKRRSVEINRFRDGRRPYLDPVAILGAESPRLALPVAQYSVATASDGAQVERYSMVAPSVISGGNSYIPSPDSIRDRHSQESPQVDVNPQANDQDALIQQFIKALMSIPEFQFVRSMMQQGGQGQPPASDPSQSSPQPQMSPPPAAGAPAQVPDTDKDGYGMGGMGMGAPAMARYDNQADPSAEGADRYSQLHEQYIELSERYQQLADVNTKNMEHMAKLTQSQIALEQRAVDADRANAIRDLYSRYPHFVDVEEESQRCLYSRGSDMSPEAFADHMQSVEKYAQRSSPVTGMLPGDEPATEQYSADFTQRVVDRYTQEASRGNIMSFEAVAELVKQGK